MNWRTTALGIVLSLPSLGCMKMEPYPTTPHVVRTSLDPDKTYAAALRVFVRRGWGFGARDPAAHAIESEWVQLGSGPYQLSYRVLVGGGEIEVFTSCQIVLPPHPVQGCAIDERPAGTMAAEASLVADILAEVQRL
ncbi:MAG: hypothetical protein HYV09_03420 [Deltaproteobacteria bacterium]|nr:hypothetical protein [Deltaproteobacteria bacterium]